MLGLRLDAATESGLARVARRAGRTKSDVVREAIRDFLKRADDDADLIAQVRAVAALTREQDLDFLDSLQDDVEELLQEQEARVAAGRAA